MFNRRCIVVQRRTKNPKPNNGQRTLVQLPDDCLLEVFKFVSLDDLCSLYSTCQRFNQIARAAFPSRPESKEWHIVKTDSHFIERTSRILRSFGDLMAVVCIQFFKGNALIDENEYRNVYNMLYEYCRETLIGLGMDDIKVHLSPTAEALMKKVKTLWFENVSRYDEKVSNVLRECKQLVSLSVHHCHLDFSLYSFPHLQTLDIVIYASQADSEYQSIDAFFRSHCDIKQLNISIEDLANLYGETVDIRFLQHLHCLEGLRIVCPRFFIKSYAPIGCFKDLRRFEYIGRNAHDTEMALREFKSAETVTQLRLDHWWFDQKVMDTIGTFRQLRKLHLDLHDEFQRDVDIKQLLDQLLAMQLSLTELHLYHATITDPGSIVDLVAAMKQLNVLNFEHSAVELTKELYLDLTKLCRMAGRKLLIHIFFSNHASRNGYLVCPQQYLGDNGRYVKICMQQFREKAHK